MELSGPAPRHTETPLASSGRPLCKVVAPGADRWRELGHRFAVRVREYSHAQPEEIEPEDLTDSDFEEYHLVLLGSILNNPAVLRLYSHGLCFTDASYPGSQGAEIRTVVDPFGTGKNVLLIGGTDFGTVHEAAINLHRSFSSVAREKDGVLALHRLNFCVTQENCTWKPSARESERILRRIHDHPEETLHLCADFALYYYQSDSEVWAWLLQEVLGEPSAVPDSGAWKFAAAWGLVQSGPHFPDDFRLDVDRMLLRLGERLSETPVRVDQPLVRGESCRALGVMRIDDHFGRIYGERPFEREAESCRAAFDRRDPGVRADGLRDWLVVDQWLSVLLRHERYELLDQAPLDDLVSEALATADNTKTPLGDQSDRAHARNVLMKIGAYQDSGSPLWVRRWLRDPEEERRYPRGTPTEAWDWYTGAYASDALPRIPDPIPRLRPLFLDAGRRSVRVLACRHDLDRAHEYLALQGSPGADVAPGGIRRLTWNGEAWLTGGAWARSDAPAQLGCAEDLSGFAYTRLDMAVERSTWKRHVLWLFREWFLLLDEWESTEQVRRGLRAEWTTHASGVDRSASEWSLACGAGKLHVVAEPGMLPDVWELDQASGGNAMRGTLLTPSDGWQLERLGLGHYHVGDAHAAVGPVNVGGLSVDATCCLLRPDALWLIGFQSLMVGDREVLRSSAPVELHVQLDRGEGRAHAGARASLTWSSGDGSPSIDLEEGDYTTRFEDFDWRCVQDALEG